MILDTVALRKHASYNYITTCINIVPEVVTEILRWIVIVYRFEHDAVELGFAPGQIHVAGLILSLVLFGEQYTMSCALWHYTLNLIHMHSGWN